MDTERIDLGTIPRDVKSSQGVNLEGLFRLILAVIDANKGCAVNHHLGAKSVKSGSDGITISALHRRMVERHYLKNFADSKGFNQVRSQLAGAPQHGDPIHQPDCSQAFK
jgi:hypothetical protein